jgi:peptidyl-prolyl cis-trans isomerase-like 3
MSVTLHTTVGDMKISLACGHCPRLCENFLALCASSSYDKCIFHRVIRGFIAQTGDPTNTGKGGENGIAGAPLADEFSSTLRHDSRGIVACANKGVRDSNGSQFYITFAAAPTLDDKNPVIGRVVEGFETLDKIESVAVSGKKFRPVEDISILSITIHSNPLAPS